MLGRDEDEARRTYVALVEEGLVRMREGEDPAWEAAGDLVEDRYGQEARRPRGTPG